MKLKVPVIYSQRDPKWVSKFLGYNTKQPYTMGNYACLITAFGMYVNKNPDEMNELLKANKGFTTESGNFIWSKSTVLGLNQVYQSPYYSNPVTQQGISKMKSLLNEGRPLICHVDFNPSTINDDQHWVLVYGYEEPDIFYICDPWTGQQIKLDTYGNVSKVVFEWRAYDKILEKEDNDTIIIPKVVFENLVFKGTKLDNQKPPYDELMKILSDRDGDLQNCNTQNKEYKNNQEQLATLLGIVNDFAVIKGHVTQLVSLEDTNRELSKEIEDVKTQLANDDIEITGLEKTLEEKVTRIKELEEQIHNNHVVNLDQFSAGELLSEIINRLFKRG